MLKTKYFFSKNIFLNKKTSRLDRVDMSIINITLNMFDQIVKIF